MRNSPEKWRKDKGKSEREEKEVSGTARKTFCFDDVLNAWKTFNKLLL
jgi:hypothetical protein